MKKKLSKLKSGQYPDWMTQVTLGSEKKKKKKNSPGCMPRTPLEAYAFDARFGKRSVFILDPRLKAAISLDKRHLHLRKSLEQPLSSTKSKRY